MPPEDDVTTTPEDDGPQVAELEEDAELDAPDNELTFMGEDDDATEPEGDDEEEETRRTPEPQDEPEEEEDEDEGEESEDEEEEETDSDDEEKKPKEKKEKEDPRLKEKVKFKAAGKEVEKTVGELVQLSQKALGAEQKMQQASEQTKKALAIAQAAERDPLGTAFRLLAQKEGEETAYQRVLEQAKHLVRRQLEYEALPEEERKRADYERQLETKRQELERLKKEEQERIAKAEEARRIEESVRLGEEIIRAAKDAGLPEERAIHEAIAFYYDAAERDGEKITVKEAVKRYKRGERKRLQAYLRTLSPDELERLSPDLVEAVDEGRRQARIEKVKGRGKTSTSKKPEAKSARPTGKPKIFKDYDEAWRDFKRHEKEERRKERQTT